MNTAPDASPRFELSAVQLMAGCLAAVTAAVLASFFGVGGTIVGTAMGSLVGTAGTAIYSHSMRRTQARIRGLTSHEGTHRPAKAGWQDYLRRSWVMIAVATVGAFVIAMTMITGVEAAAGKQLWAIVSGHHQPAGPSTSLGGIARAVSAQPSATPTPEPSYSPSPGIPAAAPTPPRFTPEQTGTPTPTSVPTAPTPSTGPPASP